MRYRKLDDDGDMTFGQGRLNFHVDSVEGVGQAVLTRLRLSQGEWFLDVTEGTPYETQILGYGTLDSRDVAIRDRVLGTQGVTEIAEYSSAVSADRRFSVQARVNTIYGDILIVGASIPDGSGIQLDFRVPGNSQYLPGLI